MKMEKIPLIISHHNEKFILEDKLLKQSSAIRLSKKIQKDRKRFRIKFIDNKFCVYKEKKGDEK